MNPSDAWRRAQSRIDRAWYAALVAATLTIVLGLVNFGTSHSITLLDIAAFTDAAVVLGLAWGIAHRSRVAAVLLLGHLALTVIAFIRGGAYGYALIATGLFGPLYVLGLHGVLAYHRLRPATHAGAGRVTSTSS
jgi:hypothetical protein